MREVDGHRHVVFRLVGSKAEHHTLVSCPCLHGIFIQTLLQRIIDTHGNIRRLPVKGDHDRTGAGIKTDVGTGVSDLPDRPAGNFLEINQGFGGDLSANDDKTCRRHGFTGNTAHGILLDAGIQNSVRDRVAHFVRMTFCH